MTLFGNRMMRDQLFNADNGDRQNVANVAVTFTDGRSNDKEEAFRQAVANRRRVGGLVSDK